MYLYFLCCDNAQASLLYIMLLENIQEVLSCCEVSVLGFFLTPTLVCFSPYITHNYIASHVQFLKKVNEGRGRQYNVWRILPVGGKFNSRGGVLALLVWYLMLVYAAVAIPVSGLYGSRKITLIHPYAAQ